MNIGIVTNSAWNIFNFRRSLIAIFLAQGHKVFAIAPDDGYGNHLTKLGCQYTPVSMDPKGSNPLKDFRLMIDLKQIYTQTALDVVLHYTVKPNIYGTLAARSCHIKCVNNVTGLGTLFIRQNIKSFVGQSLYKIAFRYPELVFFQNKDDRDLFIAKQLIRKKITDLLPGSGVDTLQFHPQTFKRNTSFTFLVVARLLVDKGINEYVNAARLLRDKGHRYRFQLLGGVEECAGLGITKDALKTWENEGLVEYLGRVDDVQPYMHQADCIVLPSYREGTPRSLLEAASLAKPIITTDVPGCKETVVNGENGFLCEAKNPLDLANKMESMANLSDRLLEYMGKKSRKLAEAKFDHFKVVAKYCKAIGIDQPEKSEEQPEHIDKNGSKVVGFPRKVATSIK
jgi:glycosyltransferase involved in cell wall biosynthesis